MLHGTWNADPTHSSLGFAIRHMVVATFRGELRDFDATLSVGAGTVSLRGSGRVASVTTREEIVARQLLGPEFLDAARHPELELVAESLATQAGAPAGDAELTIRGLTRPVRLHGTYSGPVVDPFGASRLGVELATTIDRTDWGITWNAPLPDGGLVLATSVTLTAHLELVRAADPRESP